MTIPHQRRARPAKTSLLRSVLVALLAAASFHAPAADAQECRVATSDFCVCCPPSDCRKEASFCPGGTAGLLMLEAQHPECAVNPFDATRCRGGGVIASEQTSPVAVYPQGQRARIEMSREQLDALVTQLGALRR